MEQIVKYFDLFIAAISLSFILQLLINPIKGQTSRQILAFIFLGYFISFTDAFLFYSRVMPILLSGTIIWSFNLSCYPLYFLYLKSLTSEQFSFKRKYLLLLLPFMMYFVIFTIFYVYDAANDVLLMEKGSPLKMSFLKALNFVYTSSIYINLLQFISYSYLIVIMLREHRRKIKEYFSFEENISLRWFSVFLVIYIIYHGIDNILDLVGFGKAVGQEIRVAIFIIRIIYLLFLGIFGVKQMEIYKKTYFTLENKELSLTEQESKAEKEKEKKEEEENEKILEKFEAEEVKKEDIERTSFLLSKEKKQKLMDKIEELMQEKGLFKNPQLSVFDIATELNTNTRYISLVINDIRKINFNVYINLYRVQEAEKLLKEKNDLRIEDIMYECGFNSKSSFNNSFRKITGLSPTEFRKNNSS